MLTMTTQGGGSMEEVPVTGPDRGEGFHTSHSLATACHMTLLAAKRIKHGSDHMSLVR